MHFLGLLVYFFSVRLYPKIARNPHNIRTQVNGTHTNGVSNGHINHTYINETKEEIVKERTLPQKKKSIPSPPDSPELNQALRALDDVLSSDSVRIPVSGDFRANGDACEENVVALVHRADSVNDKSQNIIKDLFLSEAPETVSVKEENEMQAAVLVENQVEVQLPEETKEINSVQSFEVTIPRGRKNKAPPPPIPQTENLETISSSPEVIEELSTLPPAPPPPPPLPPANSESVDVIPVPPPLPQIDKQEELIPPPPPFVNLRKAATLPAASPLLMQQIKEFENVTLKPVKTVALNSSEKSEEPPPDDHIEFGSKQHENFRRKLEGVFQKSAPYERPNYIRPITIHGNNFKTNGNKQLKPVKKRESIQNPELERTASFLDVKSKFERTLNINPIKLEHSQRMASTLQSIRLRKPKNLVRE